MSVETYKGTLLAPNSGTVPVRQNVGGVPFTPRVVLFFSACSNAVDSSQANILECFGAASAQTQQPASIQQCVVANASDGGSATAANAGRIARFGTECICLPSSGTPAIDALARCVSRNSDGFSLDWTDVASASGLVVHWLAIGGSDITEVGIVDVVPSSTTNGATQAVSFGFQPDVLITVSPAVPSATGIVDANICIGAATPAGQYASFWFDNDAAADMDCAVYNAQNRAGAMPSSTAVKDADYSIQSWDATGVTLLWNDAPAALSQHVYMLGIKGGQWEIDAISSPASTGTQSVSTGFPPKGVVFFGSSDGTDTDNTAPATVVDSQFSVGACDSALRQGGNTFIQQDANATSQARRRTSSSKAVTRLTGTSATLQAEATVSALGATSYTLNWTTASATAHKFAGLAIGDTIPTPPVITSTPPAPG